MADPQELTALKASFRGALGTADRLASLKERIESLDGASDLSSDELAEWERITAAHAIASAALRGLVGRMIERRAADGG